LKTLGRRRGTGILAAALAALLAGCGDSGSTAGPSATPQAASGLTTREAAGKPTGGVPKPGHLMSGNATLSWEAPTSNTNGTALTDLSGYRIYYGASEDEMLESVQITNVGLQTYVIENLQPGTWYFAIRALSSAGTESPLSDIVSKTIG
jgi:Fibronectin type III domain